MALAFAAGALQASIAWSEEVVEVITSPDVGDQKLGHSYLRALFALQVRTWPDGRAVKVFVLPDDSAVHTRFCKELLGVYPYVLRNGWDRAVFTGTGFSPSTVGSLEEMEQRVRETPGAIGYIVKDDVGRR
jgi:hypothetical protein